jgi:hypothetical protein
MERIKSRANSERAALESKTERQTWLLHNSHRADWIKWHEGMGLIQPAKDNIQYQDFVTMVMNPWALQKQESQDKCVILYDFQTRFAKQPRHITESTECIYLRVSNP